jgi:Ca-activated chloride channel family protein
MRFLHPELLWLLLALPLLGLGGWWSASRKKGALQRFAGGGEAAARFRNQVSVHRRAAKALLLYFALASMIVGAARPQWGTRLEQVTRRGVDVVVVLDTSLSMGAEDIAPSRLSHARHSVDSLLARLAGDRVALITFAGQPTLACPLTVDHSAVRLFLDSVEVETVQVPGTALAGALTLALRAFGSDESGAGERSRAVVLFSDGEDHEGGLEEASQELERAGVALYAVGVGTARGAPIPLRDEVGALKGYKKDREGKVVTTRLEENIMETLALESGGRYYRATATEGEMDEIARGLRVRYEDRYQLPLALALAALLAETLLGDRRRRRGTPMTEVSLEH